MSILNWPYYLSRNIPMCRDSINNGLRAHSLDRQLTSWINIGDKNKICILQGLTKIIG